MTCRIILFGSVTLLLLLLLQVALRRSQQVPPPILCPVFFLSLLFFHPHYFLRSPTSNFFPGTSAGSQSQDTCLCVVLEVVLSLLRTCVLCNTLSIIADEDLSGQEQGVGSCEMVFFYPRADVRGILLCWLRHHGERYQALLL